MENNDVDAVDGDYVEVKAMEAIHTRKETDAFVNKGENSVDGKNNKKCVKRKDGRLQIPPRKKIMFVAELV